MGIAVGDLEGAVDFFQTALRCEPLSIDRFDRTGYIEKIVGYEETDVRIAMLQLPGSDVLLELIEYLTPEKRFVDMETYNVGNSHISLRVEDIDAECERLHGLGVALRSSRPVEEPSGPYAGAKFLYMRSPDGITVELCQPAPRGV